MISEYSFLLCFGADKSGLFNHYVCEAHVQPIYSIPHLPFPTDVYSSYHTSHPSFRSGTVQT